jgi:hypothetical protein
VRSELPSGPRQLLSSESELDENSHCQISFGIARNIRVTGLMGECCNDLVSFCINVVVIVPIRWFLRVLWSCFGGSIL